MNMKAMGQPQESLPMDHEAEDRQEREAIKWCERLGRKMDRKRSKDNRGNHDSRNR